MDYEKKYNEALERAQKAIRAGGDVAMEIVQHIFPELRESEDERIRKYLIDELKVAKSVGELKFTIPQPTREECIAYLEKQKEQKPIGGIYWHAIKKGEKLPCRAYIWNPDYEKYHDCWEGRLIPNLEKISVGADTWYLPAKDVRNLPREGVDELPREQKPAEWSEEDEKQLDDIISIIRGAYEHGITISETRHRNAYSWLNNLRPSWKPSALQMTILKAVKEYYVGRGSRCWGEEIGSLIEDLEKLM